MTTKTTETRSAATAYAEHQKAIAAQIKELQSLLKKHAAEQKTDPKNWGFAGDLSYSRSEIQKVIDFLSGNEQ